jgi:hypothetical protein
MVLLPNFLFSDLWTMLVCSCFDTKDFRVLRDWIEPWAAPKLHMSKWSMVPVSLIDHNVQLQTGEISVHGLGLCKGDCLVC